MDAKAIQGFFMGLKGLNSHTYDVHLPNEKNVVRARDARVLETDDQRDHNEPEIEFEAALIDPDLENDGRIIYNGVAVQKPQKNTTKTVETNMEAKAEVSEYCEADTEEVDI
ncbi:hypothetical protein V8C42DRAFT_349584 [Trichoderma barbatum]